MPCFSHVWPHIQQVRSGLTAMLQVSAWPKSMSSNDSGLCNNNQRGLLYPMQECTSYGDSHLHQCIHRKACRVKHGLNCT